MTAWGSHRRVYEIIISQKVVTFKNPCLKFLFYRAQKAKNMWFDLPQPPESRGASYMWPKRSPKCRTQSTTAYSLF